MMTGDEDRRSYERELGALVAQVKLLQSGQEAIFHRLDEILASVIGHCRECGPAESVRDHEGRLRTVETKQTNMLGQASGISLAVSIIVAGVAFILNLVRGR